MSNTEQIKKMNNCTHYLVVINTGIHSKYPNQTILSEDGLNRFIAIKLFRVRQYYCSVYFSEVFTVQ
ncbi:hypothetical protein QTP88_014217 [Uroleucon formosanum]